MKSREEIAKKYFPCTCGEIYLSRNLTAPDCAFHSLEWDKALEEYAQQSQPSGMRWVRASERLPEDGITKNMKWFNGTSWQPCTGVYSQDRNRIMLCSGLKPVKNFKNIMWLDESSPAGAAEGASEGISKIREVMNWISQCVDEDHDLEVSEIKMIWNDLSDAISLIESTPHSSEGMAEALRLLDTASNLVGNPGTNISSSTDLACDSWQEKYKKFLASISPGVEDGSGWVKDETISDGFGGEWLKKCPDCGKDEMAVVRPGKVQCNNCG